MEKHSPQIIDLSTGTFYDFKKVSEAREILSQLASEREEHDIMFKGVSEHYINRIKEGITFMVRPTRKFDQAAKDSITRAMLDARKNKRRRNYFSHDE